MTRLVKSPGIDREGMIYLAFSESGRKNERAITLANGSSIILRIPRGISKRKQEFITDRLANFLELIPRSLRFELVVESTRFTLYLDASQILPRAKKLSMNKLVKLGNIIEKVVLRTPSKAIAYEALEYLQRLDGIFKRVHLKKLEDGYEVIANTTNLVKRRLDTLNRLPGVYGKEYAFAIRTYDDFLDLPEIKCETLAKKLCVYGVGDYPCIDFAFKLREKTLKFLWAIGEENSRSYKRVASELKKLEKAYYLAQRYANKGEGRGVRIPRVAREIYELKNRGILNLDYDFKGYLIAHTATRSRYNYFTDLDFTPEAFKVARKNLERLRRVKKLLEELRRKKK